MTRTNHDLPPDMLLSRVLKVAELLAKSLNKRESKKRAKDKTSQKTQK